MKKNSALSPASQNAVDEAFETLLSPPGLPPLDELQEKLLSLVLLRLALSCEGAGVRFAFTEDEKDA